MAWAGETSTAGVHIMEKDGRPALISADLILTYLFEQNVDRSASPRAAEQHEEPLLSRLLGIRVQQVETPQSITFAVGDKPLTISLQSLRTAQSGAATSYLPLSSIAYLLTAAKATQESQKLLKAALLDLGRALDQGNSAAVSTAKTQLHAALRTAIPSSRRAYDEPVRPNKGNKHR